MVEAQLLSPFQTVEEQEFHEFVKRLYAQANTRETAQFVLALLAVKRLALKVGKVWARNQLIDPYTDATKTGTQIHNQASSKEWVRRFLERLININYVAQRIEGAAINYTTGSAEQQAYLEAIVQDALHHEGKILQAFLWPERFKSQDFKAMADEAQADLEKNTPKESPPVETVEPVTEETPMPDQDTFIQDANEYIRTIYTTADDKNQARFVLIFVCLLRLTNRQPFDRKGLLEPYGKLKSAKAVTKELNAKDWSKASFDRLVEQGLISQDGKAGVSLIYRVTTQEQKDAVLAILNDVVYSDGLLLKKVLWPGEYPDASLSDTPSGEDEPLEELSNSNQEGFDLIKEVSGTLQQVATHLQSLYTGLETLGTNFDQKLTQLDQRLSGLTQLESNIEAAHTRLAKLIENDTRTKLAVISDKFIESFARRTSLANQQDAESRKIEKLADELKALLPLLGTKT